MTSYRALAAGLLVMIGCTSHAPDGVGIGDVDFRITQASTEDHPTMHIAPDGTATRVTLQRGTQTAVLDPATLDDLHAKVEAAQFPTLAPHYGCTGICPLILSPLYHMTVQLDGRSYGTEVESFFLMSQPPLFPPPLVAATTAIYDIFEHASWR
jgi:hypothetical protein